MRRPPRLAREVLERLLPPRVREQVLRDLEACWRDRGGDGSSPWKADRWYWAQLLRALVPALERRLRPGPRDGESDAGTSRAGRLASLAGVLQDLLFAARQLRRHPAVVAVVTVTLALGIGANAAIFSVVHAVLLRPLPYRDPGSLVVVTEEIRGASEPRYLSGPDLVDLVDSVAGIEDAAAIGETTVGPLGTIDRAEHVKTVQVSANLFEVLGVQAALGRTFLPEDGIPVETPEGFEPPPAAAVISHGLWRRAFGADPAVVGRVVEVWGSSYEVVGVLPRGFKPHLPPELNVPADLEIVRVYRLDFREMSRDGQWFRTVARLESGVSPDAVQSALDAFSARQRRLHPVHEERRTELRVASLRERVDEPIRGRLLLLMGAVGLVLLIACANVANLLLARGTARSGELAVRSALGAGRYRIVRQLLTESGVLVVLGTLVGLALATVGIRLLHAISPPDLQRLEVVSLNWQVLLFAVAVATATTLVAGLAPAVQAVYLSDRCRPGNPTATGTVRRAQAALAGAEIALSVVLLVGAGMLTRTFVELQAVPLGFEPDGVLTVTATQPLTSVENRRATEAELLRVARSVPGVESAGIVFPLPMNGVYERTAQYAHPGREHDESAWSVAYFQTVSPSYFRTMGIRLLRGRHLTPGDEKRDVPVTVVDRRLARTEWPGEDPLGKRIWVRYMRPEPALFEVVGVVEHVPQGGHRDPRHTLYFPRIHYLSHEVSVVARVTEGTEGVGPVLLRRLRAAFPDIPADLAPMGEFVAESLASTRFLLALMGLFAGVALVLAGVGLYGVLAYAVRQQTRELGIRRTLGARASSLVLLVVGRGARIAAAGLAIGLLASLAVGRGIASRLFEVSAGDPVVLGCAAAVAFVVAVTAALLPGIRAARTDPAVALRTD